MARNTSLPVTALLDKMSNIDKDYRYMAVNDLMTELQSNSSVAFEADMERKIVQQLMKLLEDNNSEVQNLTVKCLGPLVTQIKPEQAEFIVKQLCGNIEEANPKKTQLRDLSSMGLKNVLKALSADIPAATYELASNAAMLSGGQQRAPQQMPLGGNYQQRQQPQGAGVTATQQYHQQMQNEEKALARLRIIRDICKRLVNVIANCNDESSTILEVLDIMVDIIDKYPNVIDEHVQVLNAMLYQLSNRRLAVRKRAVTCIGGMVRILQQETFAGLMERLLSRSLTGASDGAAAGAARAGGMDKATQIETLSGVLKFGEKRCQHYVAPILDLNLETLRRYNTNTAVTLDTTADEELVEHCLHAFETVLRNNQLDPNVIDHQYLPAIVDQALIYLKYDPNYNYDADVGGSSGDGDDDDMNGDYDEFGANGNADDDTDNGEASDDEDTSWKIRRSACKVLEAVITTRPNALVELVYQRIAPQLIRRCKEREENVLLEILLSFTKILRQTKMVVHSAHTASNPILSALRTQQLPAIIGPLHQLTCGRSVRVRQEALRVMIELIETLGGNGMEQYLDLVLGACYFNISSKNVTHNTKLEALSLLQTVLKTFQRDAFAPNYEKIIAILVKCNRDDYYRVRSESLYVSESLLRVCRANINTSGPAAAAGDVVCSLETLPPNFHQHFPLLYQSIVEKMWSAQKEADQDVKERSVATVGQLVASMADCFPQPVSEAVAQVLQMLMKRLQNETIRIATLKAFTQIAKSPLISSPSAPATPTTPRCIDMTPVLAPLVRDCADFLRKTQRTLRLQSLELLSLLFERYGAEVTGGGAANGGGGSELQAVIKVLPPLINESDMQMSEYAVKIVREIVQHHSQAFVASAGLLAPPVLDLVTSPLVYDRVMQLLIETLCSIGRVNVPGLTCQMLIDKLVEQVKQKVMLGGVGNGGVAAVAASGGGRGAGQPPQQQQQPPQNTRQMHQQPQVANGRNVQQQQHHQQQVLLELAGNSNSGNSNVMMTSGNRLSLLCVSRCIAALITVSAEVPTPGASPVRKTIDAGVIQKSCQHWLAIAQNQQQPQTLSVIVDRVIAFLVLGELGGSLNSGDLHANQQVVQTFKRTLESDNDDLKAAAATGFGKLALGNLPTFLPIILSSIKEQRSIQYLMLQSLKEVITQMARNEHGVQAMQPHVQELLNIFLDLASKPEEGVRNIVAECWGKLSVVDAERLLPPMQQLVAQQNGTATLNFQRATAVGAFKYALMEKPVSSRAAAEQYDKMLSAIADSFFERIGDTDVSVRVVALLAFNTALNNRQFLVQPKLARWLELVYHETKVRQELIKEVQMGPFKHEVDEGLDCRKAAYECLFSVLERAAPSLEQTQGNVQNFVGRVTAALGDRDDIKMLGFIFIERLVKIYPLALVETLDKVVAGIQATVDVKLKEKAVKQEADKLEDMKRLALKAFKHVLSINEARQVKVVQDFYAYIRNNNAKPELAAAWAQLLQSDAELAQHQ